MTAAQRRVRGDLARRDVEHQPQAHAPGGVRHPGDALLGYAFEPQSRMQSIECGMNEDVTAAAGLERRRDTDMGKPHGSDARKAFRPGIEWPGSQRMEM